MDIEQLKAELIKLPQLKNFIFRDSEETNTFATLDVGSKHFKSSAKNEYRLGSFYSLFAAHMYKGEKGKEFFYMTISRKSEIRFYRHREFQEIEYNKIFASGNTVKKIIKSLKGYFDKGHEFL